MSVRFLRAYILAAVSAVVLMSGCSNPNKINSPLVRTGSGVAMLKILATANSPFSRIADSATVTVSATDMITFTTALTVTDSSIAGTIAGIPAGSNRLFYVAVYDSLDTLQYRGSATANVIADSSVTLSLSVTRVSGAAIVNGVITDGDVISTRGLVAYYPFNGNAKDVSGNGYNGVVNGATLAMDRFGVANQAYSFNGTSAYITSAVVNLPVADSSRSISIWIQGDSSISAMAAIGYGNGVVASNMFYINHFKTAAYLSNIGTGVDVGFGFWGNNTLIDENWHHIVVTYSKRDSTISLWIDGARIIQVQRKLNTQITNLLNIGVWQNARYWKGKLDDIRIYSRALSLNEIGSLYNEGGWTGNPPLGMKLIPAGSFQMGEIGIADTVHSVALTNNYWIDSTEVTQKQFQTLMGYNPSQFIGDLSRPVEQVTWYDAVLYCNVRSKIAGADTVYTYSGVTKQGYNCITLSGISYDISKKGYRLPTEAEWEYACRAGTTTTYWWGTDTNGLGARAWTQQNSNSTPHPVASKLPNAYGLYDMTGNVWEWCNDWWDATIPDTSAAARYRSAAQTNPTGQSTGSYRVLRGGSWGAYGLNNGFRSANRDFGWPQFIGNNDSRGFRCVRQN